MMNTEMDMIGIINSMIPSGKNRLNRTMECDSEILQLDGGQRILFTTDEFSEEDMFNDADPYSLGWNAAAGSISDILAAGGVPKFYGHALTAGRNWSEKFLRQFSRGIADVLKTCGAEFMGGDLGVSGRWRYTASVIGTLPGKEVTRRGAAPGHGLYLSGRAGAGNLNAALNIFSGNTALKALLKAFGNRFEVRCREAELIRRYASSCIDTSDGVLNALNTVADLNSTGFALHHIPYLKKGLAAAKLLSLSPLLLMMGECGEYELLFTVSPDLEPELENEARTAGFTFHRLGNVTDGFRVLEENGMVFPLERLNARARDFSNPRAYLKAMMEQLNDQGIYV